MIGSLDRRKEDHLLYILTERGLVKNLHIYFMYLFYQMTGCSYICEDGELFHSYAFC